MLLGCLAVALAATFGAFVAINVNFVKVPPALVAAIVFGVVISLAIRSERFIAKQCVRNYLRRTPDVLMQLLFANLCSFDSH